MDEELIFNLWAIFDSTTGYIYGLSGRAYKATGSDAEKLALLKSLSPTDYVTVKRFEVPKRFTIVFSDGSVREGVTQLKAVYDSNASLFEEMFKNIEADLPPLLSFSGEEGIETPQLIPDDPICVVTVLYEDEAGGIRPIITDKDREWVAQQEMSQHQGSVF